MHKKAIFFFHASADLYGSDYVLLELVKKALMRYKCVVFLPVNGPLVDKLRAHEVEVQIIDLAILRREHMSILGVMLFLKNLIKSIYYVLITQRKYDVLAFHSNTSAVWTGGFSALLSRKKHYWQVMEIIESPKVVSWTISHVVGSLSSKVFCISDAVRQHFLKNYKVNESKFVTIYHGVDRTVYNKNKVDRAEIRKKINISTSTVLIGFAGRFNAWKGQEIMALAAQIILTNSNVTENTHFIFLGSVYSDQHDYEIQLRELISASENLSSNSTVLGFQKDFQNWLGSMDILVVPSKLPEPNATVTIAAMTLGIPVIGTNIGGTVEAIADNKTGFLVPPNNPEKLAGSILELITSPNLRRQFGVNAISRSNKMFSIDNYTESVLDFVQAASSD
ncbi:MAG: glycosyltransferase family 4 protein [Candidatus Electrothrix communis]|nr:MAG: glycosyltransferase family 4 protein [Candidatus Electrothrix communis]